jgi:hypothetical protein
MSAELSFAGVGAWLATYWVHAGIAIFATFAAVHTLLRRAPAELRAAAWRAALVAPLITATLRSGVFEHTAKIEVAWLEPVATRPVDGRATFERESMGAPGAAAPLTNRTARVEPRSVLREEPAATGGLALANDMRFEAPTTAPSQPVDAADTARARSAAPRAGVVGVTEEAPTSTATHELPREAAAPALFGRIDPRRLALLGAAIGALFAFARWFDGWLRLASRLTGRRPLSDERAAEAAELARSMGVARVRISESDSIAVPMAFGFVRREVCLPASFHLDLTHDEWLAALAHELAHHVRGDARWLPALRVLSRALSFQPLNLLAWRELQRESEHAADELAVRHTGGAEALALCLAKVASRVAVRHAQMPAAAMTGAPTMAARPALVVERAERLVASIGERTRRASRTARVAVLLPTVLVAGFAPRLAPLLAAEMDERPRMGAFADDGRETRQREPAPAFASGTAAGADTVADTLADTSSSAAPSPLALVAQELATEFALAREELSTALDGAEGERRERLLELTERLSTIESRAALLEQLVHGLDARAKATTSANSPDHETERDSQR